MTATTKSEIRTWLSRAKDNGATHLIVACDTFDHEEYTVEVLAPKKVRDEYDRIHNKNMQRVMEVYALHLDLEEQLHERRAFHFEMGPETKGMQTLKEFRWDKVMAEATRLTRLAAWVDGVPETDVYEPPPDDGKVDWVQHYSSARANLRVLVKEGKRDRAGIACDKCETELVKGRMLDKESMSLGCIGCGWSTFVQMGFLDG